MSLEVVERWTRRIGALGFLGFVGVVYAGLWQASRHAKGRSAGRVVGIQRAPFSPQFLVMNAVGLAVLYGLWRPLPLRLPTSLRVGALALGVPLYLSGLALMLWGRRTLGEMYNVSTSLGAELYADHRLVTAGPFALVRHPMYLGGILAETGALLIYRTWAALLISLSSAVLPLRARREEEALAAQFGEEWAEYRRRVPLLFPRVCR